MPNGWSWNDTLIGTAAGLTINVLAWLTLAGVLLVPPALVVYEWKRRTVRRLRASDLAPLYAAAAHDRNGGEWGYLLWMRYARCWWAGRRSF